MHTVHINAVTRPDGTVLLTVPTGAPAGQQVEVEVRIGLTRKSFDSKRAWQAWIRKMSGSISDPSFERPEQPPTDELEAL